MATPTAPTPPICSLAISERTLSALRDEALSDDEMARMTAHAETCPACRERLGSFDNLAALLRSEQAPEPDERLWRGLTTSAQSRPSTRGFHKPDAPLSRQTWSRLGAIAAVLLLTLGFLTVSSLHHTGAPISGTPTASLAPTSTNTAQPTATATPDLLPANPLNWDPVSNSSLGGATAFADDGESAYTCSVGTDAQGNGVINISRTSDRGVTWTPARSVPAEPTANGCELVVDASDRSVAALAWAPRGGGAGDSYTGLMTTVDGGATWQAQPEEPFMRIDQLNSRGGVIYALRETANSSGSVEYHLWASSDRIATWRQVDTGQILSSSVAGFWLDPNGSGILAVVSGGATNADSQLWYSPDDGARWRSLSVPGGPLSTYLPARFINAGAPPNAIVARSIQGQFHICVSDATVGSSTPTPLTVTCSTDGGTTWHSSPLLTFQTAETANAAVNLVAIADDGDLLASGFQTLYRLTPGTDRWQSLGAEPQLLVTYCSQPGNGMLWAIPSGPPTTGGRNFIYTASYAS